MTPERCKAITQKGTRCTRPATSDGLCAHHTPKPETRTVPMFPQSAPSRRAERIGQEEDILLQNGISVVTPKYLQGSFR